MANQKRNTNLTHPLLSEWVELLQGTSGMTPGETLRYAVSAADDRMLHWIGSAEGVDGAVYCALLVSARPGDVCNLSDKQATKRATWIRMILAIESLRRAGKIRMVSEFPPPPFSEDNLEYQMLEMPSPDILRMASKRYSPQ